MSNATHTPTPWELYDEGKSAVGHQFAIVGNKERIATVHGLENELPKTQANAAFIVRAVNCHDELVETIKLLKRCCKEALSDKWDRSDDGFESMIEDCDRALAKAKGGQNG